MTLRKKAWLAAPLLSAALLLAACGGDKSADSSTEAAKEDGVQEIIVGTGNQMLNIAYINEDDKLAGYDIDLLKAIDEKVEDISFKYESMDFSSLLLNLESGKIDMIAHNMAKNKEREEKFLFNKQPYNAIPTHIVVNEKTDDINSLDDLQGKTVGLVPTSNASLFFEKYKKDNNLNTKITYISDTTDLNNQLKTGRIDAIFSFPFSVNASNEKSDAQQKFVGDELMFTDIYFLFDKKGTKIADEVDVAVKELIADGTVAELLEKWFDADYSAQLTK